MHILSLLSASLSGQAQSAIPSAPPVAPQAQGAASSAATVIPDISLSWGGYFQALAILCFILAALWILVWFIRRTGTAGVAASSPSMRIESRLALGPKNWLYVVRCQDKRLILGVSEKNISLVSESKLTEEEMKAPAKKSLFTLKGTKNLWPVVKKRAAAEDDFPVLQQPEQQGQSAFDSFLQEDGPAKKPIRQRAQPHTE